MKQKETLEAILGLVSAGAGLGLGIYLTRDVGNSTKDFVFKSIVTVCSVGLTSTIAMAVDDLIIRPYYRTKYSQEKDAQTRNYEKEL